MALTDVARAPSLPIARMNWLWLGAKIFAPFGLGYFPSYLLRNINAVIAPSLSAEFLLDPGHFGALTASYFLGFALMQIPIGYCLDRFNPGSVQAALFVVAAGGAALFGFAHSPGELLVARLLVGIGVAAGLVAGLKSIALWFPNDRIPVVNGAFIAVGSLGAVAATVPSEWVLGIADWRSLFVMLAGILISAALLFWLWVPRVQIPRPLTDTRSARYGKSCATRGLAPCPVSGASIGSAWALQGLWASPWLVDVAGLDHRQVVAQLLVMALCLSLGAVALGGAVRSLKRRGVDPSAVLAALVTLFMTSELLLAMLKPAFTLGPWCIIALMGAGTVVTYSITATLFESSVLGRVNGVINLFHIGGAFIVRSGIGLLVAQWHPVAPGHYPAEAYTVASWRCSRFSCWAWRGT